MRGNKESVTNSTLINSKFFLMNFIFLEFSIKLTFLQFYDYRHLNRIADNRIPIITKSKFDSKTAR